MLDISRAQENFSRLNLAAFQTLVRSLADDKARLLELLQAPEQFLRRELPNAGFSDAFHCHVVVGGIKHPEESTHDAESSLIFRTHLDVKHAWMPEVTKALEQFGGNAAALTPAPSPKPTPEPELPGCRNGCGECAEIVLNFGKGVIDPGKPIDHGTGIPH